MQEDREPAGGAHARDLGKLSAEREITEDHDGGGARAAVPALAHVGALRLRADRCQLEAAKLPLEVLVPLALQRLEACLRCYQQADGLPCRRWLGQGMSLRALGLLGGREADSEGNEEENLPGQTGDEEPGESAGPLISLATWMP